MGRLLFPLLFMAGCGVRGCHLPTDQERAFCRSVCEDSGGRLQDMMWDQDNFYCRCVYWPLAPDAGEGVDRG